MAWPTEHLLRLINDHERRITAMEQRRTPRTLKTATASLAAIAFGLLSIGQRPEDIQLIHPLVALGLALVSLGFAAVSVLAGYAEKKRGS